MSAAITCRNCGMPVNDNALYDLISDRQAEIDGMASIIRDSAELVLKLTRMNVSLNEKIAKVRDLAQEIKDHRLLEDEDVEYRTRTGGWADVADAIYEIVGKPQEEDK